MEVEAEAARTVVETVWAIVLVVIVVVGTVAPVTPDITARTPLMTGWATKGGRSM